MLGWLRRLWRRHRYRGRGYRCNGCGRWTPRSEGRADARTEEINVPPVGNVLPGGRARVVGLYCPTCVERGV